MAAVQSSVKCQWSPLSKECIISQKIIICRWICLACMCFTLRRARSQTSTLKDHRFIILIFNQRSGNRSKSELTTTFEWALCSRSPLATEGTSRWSGRRERLRMNTARHFRHGKRGCADRLSLGRPPISCWVLEYFPREGINKGSCVTKIKTNSKPIDNKRDLKARKRLSTQRIIRWVGAPILST